MFDFVRSPSLFLQEENAFTTWKGFYHGFLLLSACLLLLPCGSILLLLIDHYFLQPVFHHSIYHELIENSLQMKNEYGASWLFLLTIVGPLAEEIIFRMPLTLRRTGVAFALGLVTYRISAGSLLGFCLHCFDSYLRLLPALVIFIIVMRCWPQRTINRLRTDYYPLCFYTLTTLFALVHITNFYPFHGSFLLLPFYPLFTLPQWIMGLFLGYARLKHGFLFAVLMHGIINFLGSLSVG